MSTESVVAEAVKRFPVMERTIGSNKLISLAQKDPKSPLIYYLIKSQPKKSKVEELVEVLNKDPKHIGALIALDHILRPLYILSHLDNCLVNIAKEKGLDAFLNHLLNSESFWQGYCEVEVASNIKKVLGSVQLEPGLPSGKTADIKFVVDSKDVFVEVTAPKWSYKYVKKMEESAGKVVELEAPVERASEKILTEFEHFASVLNTVKSVVVVNLNQCEIEDIDIEDSLMGVSKLVILKNASTREIQTKVARGDWTVFSRDSRLAKLGAIVCYRREFALSGSPIYDKRVFALSFDKTEYEPLLELF